MAALVMDAVLGDPQWIPHPVRLIGAFAAKLEQPWRSLCRNAFVAGLVLWLVVLTTVGGIVGGILFAAYRIYPPAGDILGIVLLYFGIGCRDLLDHSRRVHKSLVANDLPEARRRLGMMVGRDTANLDQAGIVRATVESIAESLLDGVTAPIFFAVLGGPVGMWLYKTVNTLDSMFGHKDRQYILFGRTSAKIDDAANYIPARLTAPLVAIAALLIRIFHELIAACEICASATTSLLRQSKASGCKGWICSRSFGAAHIAPCSRLLLQRAERLILSKPVIAGASKPSRVDISLASNEISRLTGFNARNSLRILRQDGRKHSSPNAGLCEAAFAGAMEIRLGGLNYYDGQPESLPTMGDDKQVLTASHIRQANLLMIATTLLFLFLLISIRLLATRYA